MNRTLLALRLTGLGWYVASCIVVGVVGGVLLDTWLGLKPLFTLLGILFGTTAAFYGLFQMIKPLIDPERSNKPDEKSPNSGGTP